MITNISRQLTTGALAIAATVASFPNVASASTLVTVPGGQFNNPRQVTEIDQTGTLNKFDSSLGDLVSATLTLSGSFLQSFTGTNTAQQTQIARILTAVNLFFNIPGYSGAFPLPPQVSFGIDTGDLSYSPGEVKNFGPFDEKRAVSFTISAPGDLAFFDSSGQAFDVTCVSLSDLRAVGGGGNISVTQNTQAGCHASIEYTYSRHTAVPEPSAILGILAVAGVGAFALRRS